jgi:hypothetical protein
MKCEEFEAIGLERSGLRMSELDAALRDAAAEHAARCPSCAALQESWQEARIALQALRERTRDAETPRRVEMRLRHEFGIRHRTARARSAAMFAAWALAAAAVLVGAITWIGWHDGKNSETAERETPAVPQITRTSENPAQDASGRGAKIKPEVQGRTQVLVASNDPNDFTLLPGTVPGPLEDATVVRVQLQRGALGALGLTVNEERATDWIQVDLLIGDDGQPQAVRLPQSAN